MLYGMQAKLEPVDLQSFKPPLAKQFAMQQLQLMRRGMREDEAYVKTEEEFLGRIRALQR
jgi:hypothetical protein